MAVESGEKTVTFITKAKANAFIPLLLRILAFVAATSATLVMALNKENETFVVATVGTTPIKATLTAKFNHTPAFVYFVIANAIAGFHSLLMLAVEYFGHKFDIKGLRFAVIPTLDVLILALVSGGATAAAFMGEVGRNGNSHARWNKTCDKFNTFCDRASVAMLASFITLLLLIIITIISIFKLQIRKSISYTTLP